MRFIKRVYVAGVGYTSYLTKSPIKTTEEQKLKTSLPLTGGNASEKSKTEKKGSESSKTGVSSKTKVSPAASSGGSAGNGEVYLDHIRGSKTFTDKDHTYTLNLKIGFSDLKLIDLTPYLTEEIEILVVGKEIITTPGYQELASEIDSLVTASEIKSIIIIRGENKVMVNSLAALIRNLRPYSVYKGIGLRLEGDPLILKTFVKNKH